MRGVCVCVCTMYVCVSVCVRARVDVVWVVRRSETVEKVP